MAESNPRERAVEFFQRAYQCQMGGDYDMASLAETRVVESYGGRALAIPFVAGYSTTQLVRRIRGEKK